MPLLILKDDVWFYLKNKNVWDSRSIFFLVFTTNLIWFEGQFWHQVVPAPFRSQLRGIEPWSSLPSSTSITTEQTNDWYLHRHFVSSEMLNNFKSLTPSPPSFFGRQTSFQLTQKNFSLVPEEPPYKNFLCMPKMTFRSDEGTLMKEK
jgi:hypothetical protein